MGDYAKCVIIGIFKGIIDQESVFSTKEQTRKSRLAWIEIDLDSNIYTLHSVITIWPTYDEIINCFSVQGRQNNTGSKRPKNAFTSQNLAENDQSVLLLELWPLTHDNRPSRDYGLRIHS